VTTAATPSWWRRQRQSVVLEATSSSAAGQRQIGSPPDGSYDKICGRSDFVEAGWGDYVAPDCER